jgi:uncharacterized protein (DUF302 family)
VIAKGIVEIKSQHTVDDTVIRLRQILEAKGVKLFAVVDHSGEAASVGMSMPPTKLLIFGNPKAGIPLMLTSPSTAIDLPLKLLVSEDAGGAVTICYNSPVYLQQRHGLPENLIQNIASVEGFAKAAAG